MALGKISLLCFAVLCGHAWSAAPANPIVVQSAVNLGNQTSNNFPYVVRDGGYESRFAGGVFLFYSDTLTCPTHNCDADGRPVAANTLANATANPLVVHDIPGPDGNGNPITLCKSPVSGYRFHLTNIVGINSTSGVAWYVNISSDTSNNIDGNPVGSGVAIITYTAYGPLCNIIPQYWGTDEPAWGGLSAFSNIDGYTYVYGGTLNGDGGDAFLARVPTKSAATLSAYTYWNGTAYSSQRLRNPYYAGYAPASVMQGIHLGAIHYNAYYQTFVYVYKVQACCGQINAITSPNFQGPWSAPVTIYTAPGVVSGVTPQTNYDNGGKSLVLVYSIMNDNWGPHVAKVTYK